MLELAEGCECPLPRTNEALIGSCDLGKDAAGRGVCSTYPRYRCYLKRHTELLKRYGHFGKVPTSIALMVQELGVEDLPGLRRSLITSSRDKMTRAMKAEQALSGAWRVNQKIASMFLSAVSDPDLSRGSAPWSRGLDWSRFVVVDSNVDLFLRATGYVGLWTYNARREFIQLIAERIPLKSYRRTLHDYNPRLVQQAFYVFMSVTNRRAVASDCMHVGEEACRMCPRVLQRICLARSRAR